MPHSVARLLAGVTTVAAIVGVVLFAVHMFGGGFTKSVPVTVLSPRAGLVMYPDARVQMRGIQVGKGGLDRIIAVRSSRDTPCNRS